MKIKNKTKRIIFITVTFSFLSIMTIITLANLRSNISFFYTISEALANNTSQNNKSIRIGGLVVEGSLEKHTNTITFKITDFNNEINVIHHGILPPMFLEGTMIVAKGKMHNNTFFSEEVLAKHDEKYVPKKYKSIKKTV